MNKLFTYLYGGGSDYLLGRSVKTGLGISYPDNNRCTFINGLSGIGKTNLMTSLCLTDIVRNDRSVVVLDPHNSLVKSIALKCPPEHAHRITYFYPVGQTSRLHGLNPLERSSSSSRAEFELKASACMEVIEHTWAISHDIAPTMQNTLETFFRTLLAAYPKYQTSVLHMLALTNQKTLGDYWRDKLSEVVKMNPGISQNWDEWLTVRRRETDIESSRQKIKHLTTGEEVWRILGQPTSTIRFDEIVANKGVLLVALQGLEPRSIKLLGSFILTQVLIPIWLRGEGVGAPCNIYADEFYYFHPRSFEKIIDEGRKYRVFCTIASQSLKKARGAAAQAALRCRNLIVFRSDPEDTTKLKKHFVSCDGDGYLDPRVLSNLREYQAKVKYERDGVIAQARIDTLKDPRQENRSVAQLIWKNSIARARPIQEIERYRDTVLNPVTVLSQQQSTSTEAIPVAGAPIRQRKRGNKTTNGEATSTPLSPTTTEG